MRIDQVVIGASPGDAVTKMAMNLRADLRRSVDSDLYAWALDPRLQGDVIPLHALPDLGSESVVIYHSSIGQPEATRILLDLRSRLVLHYHNITPASYFAASRPDFAPLLAWGRRELVLLRDRVVAASAVSAYNASELESLDYRDVFICPVGVDPEDLLFLTGSTAGAEAQRRVGLNYVLAVAQQLPHKRVEFLLQSQAILERFHADPPGLVIVGTPRDASYARALADSARAWGLQKVWFTGYQPDAALASLFRRARALVSASDHEGLCAPLLEAMAFGVPVIARACAAVPSTVADAGLLLPSDSGPASLAEAVSLVLCDETLRRDLAVAGLRRLNEFKRESVAARYLNFLAGVI